MITVQPHFGWENVLVLANKQVELFITLDVGPRILRFAYRGGKNVFKEYAAQLGTTGEKTWLNRGGHRLWVAPELKGTYYPDNRAVQAAVIDDFTVSVRAAPETANGWQKEIIVALSPAKNEVKVTHQLRALRDIKFDTALWALSVMAAGGVAIVPQPKLGTHPRDLLPTRVVVPWAYTSLSDPRLTFTEKRWLVRQDAGARKPIKFGLLHTEGKVGYLNGNLLFTKTIALKKGAAYPDFGVNTELFTDQDMLEVESLAPLSRLKKGQVTEHVETWTLQKVTNTNPLTVRL
ncbi:MAG: DUF4380 domain-containing protein [Verrucomicrobiales bacterium]|jgi:hypothetical protein|nr:DUF4380 domain-containing protein [Verrucomicrobiales bacterium]